MKIVFTAFFFLILSLNAPAQKQFASQAEALTWLKDTFAKYFVKTAVNETENKRGIGVMESAAPQYFDYQVTDTYLLISRRNKNGQMVNWFVLLPFNKISSVAAVTSSEYAYYKQSPHLYIKSDCNCFKYTSGKKFTADKYDELKDRVLFPFNLNDEEGIATSIQNAFKTLSGKNVENTTTVEKTNPETAANTTPGYTIADVESWKKLYAGIRLPKQKSDLEKDGLHGQVKTQKTIYNNVESNPGGEQVLKRLFVTMVTYNANGYKTSEERVSGDIQRQPTLFAYNDMNVLVASIAAKDSSVLSRYTYDKTVSGDIQKKKITENEYSATTETYKNDDLVEIKTERKGEPASITTFTDKYDAFGNIIRMEVYNADTLQKTYEYQYNKQNVCTKTIAYDSKNAIQFTFDPRFDSKGNTTETIKTDADKTIQHVVIDKFDEKNNPLGYKVYINNTLKSVVEYELEYY